MVTFIDVEDLHILHGNNNIFGQVDPAFVRMTVLILRALFSERNDRIVSFQAQWNGRQITSPSRLLDVLIPESGLCNIFHALQSTSSTEKRPVYY